MVAILGHLNVCYLIFFKKYDDDDDGTVSDTLLIVLVAEWIFVAFVNKPEVMTAIPSIQQPQQYQKPRYRRQWVVITAQYQQRYEHLSVFQRRQPEAILWQKTLSPLDFLLMTHGNQQLPLRVLTILVSIMAFVCRCVSYFRGSVLYSYFLILWPRVSVNMSAPPRRKVSST